jgi:hypothetical protein
MSSRWACSVALADLLSNSSTLAVGTVLPHPPGDKQQDNEYVFVTGTEGTFVPGPSAAGPLIHDDEFTINLALFVRHRPTLADCMARLEEMANAVYRVVSDTPDLGNLTTDEWYVHEARPGQFSTSPTLSPEGPWASATLGIDVEVRHQGGNS